MSTINVEVNVDETEIANVEVGQTAKVKIDALGEKEVEGVVTQKNPLAVGKSDTQGGGLQNRVNVQEAKEFKVVIELRNMPDDVRNALRPGMTATANITTKTKQNVLAVPLQAVIEKPVPTPSPAADGAAGQTPVALAPGEKPKEIKGVYVLENNKVRFLEVETGITGESDIEIVSGLREGLEVITGPSRVLRTLKENASAKKQTRPPGGAGDGKAGESK
jgi:HlyD family secretion protein